MRRIIWEIYAIFYDVLTFLLPYRLLMEQITQHIETEGGKKIKILDAGCGTGNLEKEISKKNEPDIEIIGIDSSKEMIKRSNKKNKEETSVNYTATDMDKDLPYPNGYFDYIISSNSLYATKDPNFTMKEFNRVLKFGGKIIIVNPVKNPKMRGIILEHIETIKNIKDIKERNNLAVLSLAKLPQYIILVIINVFIKIFGKKKKYHFLNEKEMNILLEKFHFQITKKMLVYAETDWLFVAKKRLAFQAQKETLLVSVASEEDFDFFSRIRYNTYCEELQTLQKNDYPQKKEIDSYDAQAIHLVLSRNQKKIGYVRLVPELNGEFLMEKGGIFRIKKNREGTIEASRMIIEKPERGENASNALRIAAITWAKENGYKFICFAIIKNIFDKRKDIWSMKEICKSRIYHGQIVQPAIIQIGHGNNL